MGCSRGRYRPQGAPALTPRGRPVKAPTKRLADVIAGADDPRQVALGITMRAIDFGEEERLAVVESLAQMLSVDLLLYWVEEPDELVWLQSETWGPIVEWAARLLGADLRPVVALRPALATAEKEARAYLRRLDRFQLAAMEAAAMHLDSLLLGIALKEGRIAVFEAWEMSILEARWQEVKWGEDVEAMEAREERRREYCLVAETLASVVETDDEPCDQAAHRQGTGVFRRGVTAASGRPPRG